MNIFRLFGKLSTVRSMYLLHVHDFVGDLSHIASILILVQKIQASRSCRGTPPNKTSSQPLTVCSIGISFKTQALYVGVFVARYLDVLYSWVSLYNSVMKIFFIASSVYILYLMKVKFRSVPLTYNAQLPLLMFHRLRLFSRPFTYVYFSTRFLAACD